MYVNTDNSNRIVGYNPNDMTGNSDWYEVPETLSEPIMTDAGVPMYKYERGHAVARTKKEIDADTPEPEPQPSEMDIIKQRLDEQDDALIELASLIGG